MPMVAFHSPQLMTLALEARDRAAETRRSDPTVMAGDAVVSIVMAAAATEAFINELEAVYRTTMASRNAFAMCAVLPARDREHHRSGPEAARARRCLIEWS